jgi:O6-methylguanine-DNA--protein-cysteine methyltransferase
MIRSMQKRVNERTERYDKMIEDERTKTPPNFDPLRLNVDELTRQQNRIKTILHEIKIGKTQ